MECGMFAYCGNGAGREVVEAAMSVARWGWREWGVVACSADGATTVCERQTSVDDVRKDIDRKLYRIIGGAECVLGYVRSASCEDPQYGLQTCGPRQVGGKTWCVLNGEVSQAFRDHAYFVENRLADVTDAECLGVMAARSLRASPDVDIVDVVTAFGRAVHAATESRPFSGLFVHWGKLAVVRRGYPLWVSERPRRGMIIASVPWDTRREPCMIDDSLMMTQVDADE